MFSCILKIRDELGNGGIQDEIKLLQYVQIFRWKLVTIFAHSSVPHTNSPVSSRARLCAGSEGSTTEQDPYPAPQQAHLPNRAASSGCAPHNSPGRWAHPEPSYLEGN